MIYGIDTLAGVKYKQALRALPPDCALGFFAETFGDAYSLVANELRQGHGVRLQLLWQDNHVYGRTHIEKAKKLIKKYYSLIEEYPDKLFISPFCEHRLTNIDAIFDELAKAGPECMQLVNASIPGGSLSKKYINEVHGEDKRIPGGRYFYSYDGTACVDSDIEKMKERHKNAELFFMWTYQCNGVLKERKKNEPKIPIPQRKAWANKDLLKSLWVLHKDKDSSASLPKRHLWKSHAEQTKNQPLEMEPRACKPVCIMPEKVPYLELMRDGKVIAKSSKAYSYADGRWRYYFDKYGWTYGVCELLAGGKKLGVVDGGYRQNEYRS